ncbi:MAG: NADP-dependent methylenetetrahydromethanopterin/methylenetetrahydrofolate dehydrogenase [Candidatus Porifericomitaceae bacterium WSBS_2022_MAG_OTU9]
MPKILVQIDSDPKPSMFDYVVACDGGVDHIASYSGIKADAVSGIVEGAIFTRAPKEKKNTAIFIGGSNLVEGEALLAAVQQNFFAEFRVSVMLDSNGSNTTASAGVIRIAQQVPLAGKKAVVLAGTGPVGMRAAALLAREGANVTLTSRSQQKAEESCAAIEKRFAVKVRGVAAPDNNSRREAISDANVVFATGSAAAKLLDEDDWRDLPQLEILADANAVPPLGIEGIKMHDKGEQRHGKYLWGAIGFGSLKLSLHRACIQHLFSNNDIVLDAVEICAIGKDLA